MSAAPAAKYTKAQINRYLAWIARGMKQHRQSVFQLERMEPSWMIDPDSRRSYLRWSRLFGVLIVAACIAAIEATWELSYTAIAVSTLLTLAMGGIVGWALSRHEWARLTKSGVPRLFVFGFGALLLIPLYYMVQIVAGLPANLQNGFLSSVFFIAGLVPGVLLALPGAKAYGLFGRLSFGAIGGAVGGLAVTMLVVRLLSNWFGVTEAAGRQIMFLHAEDLFLYGLLGGLVGGVVSLAWKNHEPAWSKRPFIRYLGALIGLVAIPGVALALVPVEFVFVVLPERSLPFLLDYFDAVKTYFLQIHGIEYQLTLDGKSRFVSAVIAIALVVGFIWGRRASERDLTSDIQFPGRLRWSWEGSARGLGWGFVVGIGAGLILGATQENFLQSFWVIAVLCAVGGMVTRGLKPMIPEAKTHPNEGAYLAWGTARYVALFVGIAGGLLYLAILYAGRLSLGIPIRWSTLGAETILFGFGVGVLAGLWHGGLDVLYQIVLMWRLRKRDCIPRDLVGFLEFVTEKLGLLHRRGGGYVFEDRDLLEYFAESSDAQFRDDLEEASRAWQGPGFAHRWGARLAAAVLLLAAGAIVYQAAGSSLAQSSLKYDWADCTSGPCPAADGIRIALDRSHEIRVEVPGLAERAADNLYDPFRWSAYFYNGDTADLVPRTASFGACSADLEDAEAAADNIVCRTITASRPGHIVVYVSLKNTLPERALYRRIDVDLDPEKYLAAERLANGRSAEHLVSLADERSAWREFLDEAETVPEESRPYAWWSYDNLPSLPDAIDAANDRIAEIDSLPAISGSGSGRDFPGPVASRAEGIEFCGQGEKLTGNVIDCERLREEVCRNEGGFEHCVAQFQTCGVAMSVAVEYFRPLRGGSAYTRYLWDVSGSDSEAFGGVRDGQFNVGAPADRLQHTGTWFNPGGIGVGDWTFRVFADDDFNDDQAGNSVDKTLLATRAFRVVADGC